MNRGERVVIGNEIKGFAAFLPLDRGAHHPEVIAEVKFAGRLDAREDARCGH